MIRKITAAALAVLLCLCLAGCSVTDSPNGAVSFRLENAGERTIYIASVAFGTEDTVFASISGENADGTPLSAKGKDGLLFTIEEGDMNGAKLEDMTFDFYVCTQKDSDFVFVGRVSVTSPELHRSHTLTVTEEDGRLTLTSADPAVRIESDTEE